MASIGQELLNVPMGDMIKQMAFAIAEGQYQLDENSINVAEMMGGLTTVYDEKGDIAFDDSRVFFGYEYMTIKEARAFAAVDDALTGTLGEDIVKLEDILSKLDKNSDGTPLSDDTEIRVPTRLSMLELGFTPVFYHFVDTIIEVKIAIKITRSREFTRTSSNKSANSSRSNSRKRSFWGTSRGSSGRNNVSTSQVDASYSSKYSYSAEGASVLRTKLSPVPPPAILEERIRGLMESEEARREASLQSKRKTLGLDEPEA